MLDRIYQVTSKEEVDIRKFEIERAGMKRRTVERIDGMYRDNSRLIVVAK